MKKPTFKVLSLIILFISTYIFANTISQLPQQKLSINKSLIKNFYTDVWTKSNRNAVYKYVSSNASGYINGNRYNLSGLMQRLEHFDSINTNISADIKDLIAEKNKVAVYVYICSTTKDTKKRFCVPNLGLYTIKNKQIIKFITTSPVPSIYKFKPTK